MRFIWLGTLLLLSGGSAQAATFCDGVCQTDQITALSEFYNTNGGSNWSSYTAAWATFTPTTPFATVCNILSSTQTGYCCFASNTTCTNAGVSGEGIAGLTLPFNQVTGTLPDSLILALAPTILVFSMYGMTRAQQAVFSPGIITNIHNSRLYCDRQPAEWNTASVPFFHDASERSAPC